MLPGVKTIGPLYQLILLWALHRIACCATIYGNSVVYVTNNVIHYGDVAVHAPLNVLCLSKNMVALTDGNRTYFYLIHYDILKPLPFVVDGTITRCSYSGRFLAYATLRGVEVRDLEMSSEYFFEGAIGVKAYENSFLVLYLNKVVSWTNNKRIIIKLNKDISDATIVSGDRIAICEGEKELMLYNDSSRAVRRIDCNKLFIVGNSLVDVDKNKYFLIEPNSLEVIGKGELKCVPKHLEAHGSRLLVLCPNGIYIYEVVRIERDTLYFLLTVVALGSVILSAIAKIRKEWLEEY